MLSDLMKRRKNSKEKLHGINLNECSLGIVLRNAKMGGHIKKCVEEFPQLKLVAIIQPITRAVLRVRLNIKANFMWVL